MKVRTLSKSLEIKEEIKLLKRRREKLYSTLKDNIRTTKKKNYIHVGRNQILFKLKNYLYKYIWWRKQWRKIKKINTTVHSLL